MREKLNFRKKLFFSFFGVLVLVLGQFYAQDIISNSEKSKILVLSVDEAVDYAKQNSRTLKSAAIDLEMKKRAGSTAWNVFVPSMQVSGTMSRTNEYSSTYSTIAKILGYSVPETTESMHWSAVGSLSVSLNLSLALIQGIHAVHADYEAGKITWDQTLNETELNVRKLFYGLLLQQESLQLQETTLENAREREIQAELNFKNGTIPELQLLQTQVSYENQKPTVEKQEQLMQQQLDTFVFLLGLPVGTKIKLQGKIEPQFVTIDADDLILKYAENNPDVIALKKNIQMLEIQASALDLQSFTPVLSFSWGYQPVSADTQGKGALDMNWLNSENWYDNGAFSATVAWDFAGMLPFSANRQKAKDLRDSIAKMNISLDTLRQNTELDVRKEVDSLEQSQASIKSSERSIMLAQKAYDMSAAAYRNGTTELLDLRDAETQLNQAKLGLANEQYNYLSGLLDLEYKLGTNLTKKSGTDSF